jgi:hypothetical protein
MLKKGSHVGITKGSLSIKTGEAVPISKPKFATSYKEILLKQAF